MDGRHDTLEQALAGGEKLILSFGSATSSADMPFRR